MDKGEQKDYRPRIKRILENFQESVNSMKGPNECNTFHNGYHTFSANTSHLRQKRSGEEELGNRKLIKLSHTSANGSTRNQRHSVSVLSSHAIRSELEVIYTSLENEEIPGFEVGGELRLCLPSILKRVLVGFNSDDIEKVRDTFSMYLASCTEGQLKALKSAHVIPAEVQHCGLITKTDAERLCEALLHRNSQVNSFALKPALPLHGGLRVAHECFGGCEGMLYMNTTDKRCIACCECSEQFTPSQFVAHCHHELEKRACHWGFNPARWKSYILLSDSVNLREWQGLSEQLEAFKSSYQEEKSSVGAEEKSRDTVKEEGVVTGGENTDNKAANWRIESCLNMIRDLQASLDKKRATEVLPPFLHTGDPILANSSTSQLSRTQPRDASYIPNVSLDPGPYAKLRAKYPVPCKADDAVQCAADDRKTGGIVLPCGGSSGGKLEKNSFNGSTNSLASDDNGADDSLSTQSLTSDKLHEEDDCKYLLELRHDLDKKMGMVKRAAEDREYLSDEMKKRRLDDFISIQSKYIDMIGRINESQLSHDKELTERWRQAGALERDMVEDRERHAGVMVKLKQENATRMREAALERMHLMQRVEALAGGAGSSELAMMATRYKQEADKLKQELANKDEINSRLKQQIVELRSAVSLQQQLQVQQRQQLQQRSTQQWRIPAVFVMAQPR